MKPIQLRSSLSLSWENTNCNAWYLTEAAKAARNRREISPLDSDSTHGDHIEIQINQPLRDSIVFFFSWRKFFPESRRKYFPAQSRKSETIANSRKPKCWFRSVSFLRSTVSVWRSNKTKQYWDFRWSRIF